LTFAKDLHSLFSSLPLQWSSCESFLPLLDNYRVLDMGKTILHLSNHNVFTVITIDVIRQENMKPTYYVKWLTEPKLITEFVSA
jgi:hypothetical protein